MKKLTILIVFAILIIGCAVDPLKNISTSGLTYSGDSVFYNGELCAELSAIEIAYDDGKIVREATFVLTDSKYNELALPIIALVKTKQPSLEVEVELKSL